NVIGSVAKRLPPARRTGQSFSEERLRVRPPCLPRCFPRRHPLRWFRADRSLKRKRRREWRPFACASGFDAGTRLTVDDNDDLWRLLCAMTLNKVRQQARYHRRQKRDLAQERPIVETGSTADWHPAAPGPTPAEAAEFADQFAQLIAALDDEERQIVELKLQD